MCVFVCVCIYVCVCLCVWRSGKIDLNACATTLYLFQNFPRYGNKSAMNVKTFTRIHKTPGGRSEPNSQHFIIQINIMQKFYLIIIQVNKKGVLGFSGGKVPTAMNVIACVLGMWVMKCELESMMVHCSCRHQRPGCLVIGQLFRFRLPVPTATFLILRVFFQNQQSLNFLSRRSELKCIGNFICEAWDTISGNLICS